MSLEEALEYYDKGILPKKDDDLDDFIVRSGIILKSAYEIQKTLKRPISKEKASNALEMMFEEYGFDLSWVPRQHIWSPMPGYGGCNEVYQGIKKYGSGVTDVCYFLMPRISINKLRIVGSFNKILKHELIHASRIYIENYIYTPSLILEEYIAWDEEKRNRFLNSFNLAIYDKHKLYLLLGIEMLGFASMIFFNSFIAAAPFAVGATAFYAHDFSKAYKNLKSLKNLKKTLKDLFNKKGKHVLSRLSEKEIKAFYKLNKEEIKKYIDNENSLKWQLIKSKI